jgi:hypothetical protein
MVKQLKRGFNCWQGKGLDGTHAEIEGKRLSYLQACTFSGLAVSFGKQI